MRRQLFGRNSSFNAVALMMCQLRTKTSRVPITTSSNSNPNPSHPSTTVSAALKSNVKIPHIPAQRRIREIMVRQVLLSSEPLTVRALVDLVTREYGDAGSVHESTTPQDTSDMTVVVSGHIGYLHDFLLSTAKRDDVHSIPHEGESCASQVEGAVRLLLALDPQFRVSPAGYVCYPNIPSMLVPTTNVDHNEAWVRTTRRLVRLEETKHGNGVAGGKETVVSRWSYMLSLWYLLDSVIESDDATSSTETSRILSTSLVGNGSDISLSQCLADLWVNAFDARDIPVLLRSDAASPASSVNTTRTDTKCHTPLELHACDEGNDYLRRWCAGAKEGYVGTALLGAPLLTQSSSTLLHLINDQLGYLFTIIIATPITLGQLAGLLQWASLPFAAHYRSLLHFLLVYAGNPAVFRMEQHEMRRREAQRRWVELLRVKRTREDHRVRHKTSRTHAVDGRLLTGRYASQECVEEATHATETSPIAAGDVSNNNTSPEEGMGATREVSAAQYGWWWRSSDGFSVNPRLVDVCRCVFMQPGEMAPLDVNERTPSEVLEAFDDAEKVNTANSIVVFSAAPYVFERRICRIMRSWWALEGQYAVRETLHGVSISPPADTLHGASGSEKTVVITVRRLCQLCLWEHEYGADTACNMMLHYLKLVTRGENVVQLIPPSSSSSSSTTTTTTSSSTAHVTTESSMKGGDAGTWLVLLRDAREGGTTETSEGVM